MQTAAACKGAKAQLYQLAVVHAHVAVEGAEDGAGAPEKRTHSAGSHAAVNITTERVSDLLHTCWAHGDGAEEVRKAWIVLVPHSRWCW